MRSPAKVWNAWNGWVRYMDAYSRMSIAASEIVLRRSQRMALGAVTASEAAGMITEKTTAFALASERAVLTAARGSGAAKIATAAIGPYGAKTRSNLRKLRK